MRKLLLFLAFCGGLPIAILAQDNSANTPQPKPADTQDKSTPTLEKPGMAPATPETAPAKLPAKKTPAPETKIDPSSGRVVEEIIARVNNEIITQSEYEKAKVAAADEAKQDCQGHCTPEQLQIAIEDRQKNALRDLIDQSLLVQRGKDMGLSVEPDVIKKLDQIRIQNNINSMEDLEKAVSAQGVNWEDFKNNIRNGVLTQRVISSEVGSHITIGHDEIEKYYNEHKSEFVRPEQVALRSIEINTEKKSPEEIVELKKKAEATLKRIKDGEDFGEMAKRFSDGSTAKQGGFLGVYKRGELSKELEDVVFKMRKNDITDVMDTKQGFLILQVLEHYDEGEQTLAKVEPEITDKLYTARMEPAMREYVKTLREQSYVVIKPGFQDMAGGGNSEIQEVSATAEASKKTKKAHKKYGLFGKKPDTGL
ncbi:MAG TPA: peptidylprolyl isomerase [Verrucomicrobiae bacterium]|jgi:peptidyl-prolyl cis-trans isomerase SurA|nr:peptidylprolyl isomerase [Verrucomicrobiae bacterium]